MGCGRVGVYGGCAYVSECVGGRVLVWVSVGVYGYVCVSVGVCVCVCVCCVPFPGPAQDTLVTRPALGVMPPLDYIEQVKRTFLSIAPTGLDCVTQMMCGTCSNENAFKAAMIHHMVSYMCA